MKMTHGISTVIVNPDKAVSKKVDVFYNDDKAIFGIEFETVWEEGKPPIKTQLSVSGEAMNALVDAYLKMVSDLPNWKLIDDIEQPRNPK